MSTTPRSRRDDAPRAGARRITRREPDRWREPAAGAASDRAPVLFDAACDRRLPNTCDAANRRI